MYFGETPRKIHFGSGLTFHQIPIEITLNILSCIWNAVIIANCVLRVALENVFSIRRPFFLSKTNMTLVHNLEVKGSQWGQPLAVKRLKSVKPLDVKLSKFNGWTQKQ